MAAGIRMWIMIESFSVAQIAGRIAGSANSPLAFFQEIVQILRSRCPRR
jgi:hypothetical protein